jgi:hypothetical protein
MINGRVPVRRNLVLVVKTFIFSFYFICFLVPFGTVVVPLKEEARLLHCFALLRWASLG